MTKSWHSDQSTQPIPIVTIRKETREERFARLAYQKRQASVRSYVLVPTALHQYLSAFILSDGSGETLSKKNRRRRQAHQPQPDSKIFFSLPTVRLLKDALSFFEGFLYGKVEPLPNIPFAKDVTAGLHTKLDDMLQREEWEKEIPFDYNEIHILYSSVHMYLIELRFTHQHRLIPPCIALCKQFSMIIEHVGVMSRKEL
jgi:hypothetical protein